MINNLLIHTTWRKKLSEILSEILGLRHSSQISSADAQVTFS